MNASDPVPEIMYRTMYNLSFIERHSTDDGPYEVTQLVNSFLGALAYPWEKYKPALKDKSLEEAAAVGWPTVQKERDTDEEPESVGDLLRLVRNAIAHGNLEFIAGSRGEIEKIRLHNNRGGRRTWGTTLTVVELRRFLDCFVALAEELHDEALSARTHSNAGHN
ncbi:MAG: HEPN family nuclease [Anaerolineae bacterium]